MVFIHQFASRQLGFLLSRTGINMKFGTRSTRACIAHFPEVIVLVTIDDMVFWQELLPDGCSLIVTLQSFLRRTFKDGRIEVGRIDFQDIDDILPRPTDGFLLEIVAKRPVAQHLEHRVVIGVVTYFLQVVVLSAHTQTFLRVGHTTALWLHVTQDDILELVHTCIGKHKGWVVLHYHRSRRHDEVLF